MELIPVMVARDFSDAPCVGNTPTVAVTIDHAPLTKTCAINVASVDLKNASVLA